MVKIASSNCFSLLMESVENDEADDIRPPAIYGHFKGERVKGFMFLDVYSCGSDPLLWSCLWTGPQQRIRATAIYTSSLAEMPTFKMPFQGHFSENIRDRAYLNISEITKRTNMRPTATDVNLAKQLIKFACSAAEQYASNSPSVSRFRMFELNSMKKLIAVGEGSMQTVCPYCGSVYQPGNHKVRLQPRAKLTAKVSRLLKRITEGAGGTLGKCQHKLVADYLKRQNRLIFSCDTCRHRTVIGCEAVPQRNLSQHTAGDRKEVKNSKSSKKRMKRKRKYVEISLIDGGSDTPGSSSLSSLHSSGFLAAKSTTRPSSVPRFTSTPKIRSVQPVGGNLRTSTPTAAVTQLTGSSAVGGSSGLVVRSKNRKSRQKTRHSLLKNMLDSSRESQAATGTLQDFLSSVTS